MLATCELHGNQVGVSGAGAGSCGDKQMKCWQTNAGALSLDKFQQEASPGMCCTITHRLFSFAKDTPVSQGSVLRMPVNKQLLVISLCWLKADFGGSGTSRERNFREHGVFLAHM